MKKKLVFIGGCFDVEMVHIMSLCEMYGVQFLRARYNGKLVGRKNANQANHADRFINQKSDIVFVECRVDGVEPTYILDHHKEGDPGFSISPREYPKGSSLGQAWELLAKLGRIEGRGVESEFRGWTLVANQWTLFDEQGKLVEVPKDHMLAMAADHCLSAAYSGDCPGISIGDMADFRIKTRAKHQCRSASDVEMDIDLAFKYLDTCEVRDVGGEKIALVLPDVPELAEAAARKGVGFESCMYDKTCGMWKHKIISGNPVAVEAWLSEAREYGLKDIYGSPVRGYAGGYRPVENSPSLV